MNSWTSDASRVMGSGRASLAALAASYGPVMNYYLSIGDWAADATGPIEKQAR